MTWWPWATPDRADISALGWDYFSWETAAGVAEAAVGAWASPPRRGRCRWGRWCSSREALRVSQVTGSLGGPADGPVLAATSDRHVVTIPLDVSQQSRGEGG